MKERRVTFPCGEISLEGAWHFPEGNGPFPAVIVCHPHPLYGGDMDNNIVRAICEALPKYSIPALRFNFRGVGESGGSFGGGIGEQDDVTAAMDFALSAPGIDANRLGLAGYSFGAGIIVPVALQDKRVRQIALVSPALDTAGWAQLRQYRQGKLIMVGNIDTFVPLAQVEEQFAAMPRAETMARRARCRPFLVGLRGRGRLAGEPVLQRRIRGDRDPLASADRASSGVVKGPFAPVAHSPVGCGLGRFSRKATALSLKSLVRKQNCWP